MLGHTPSPTLPRPRLVKILTSEFMFENLAICLPTDYLPTTETVFSFQLSFEIIVFVYCRHKNKYTTSMEALFLFFKTELFTWFFVAESVANGFIDAAFVTAHARLYGSLQEVKNSKF